MIKGNQQKKVYYMNRRTNVDKLVAKMISEKKKELKKFLSERKNKLKSKKEGKYYTVKDVTKTVNDQISKMQRFFRGAVVPFYARQQYDYWEEKLPTEIKKQATEEIKRSIGFMRYNHKGELTDEVNSTTNLREEEHFREFLNEIESVCFQDNGYKFPNSKKYNELVSRKNRNAAKKQQFHELKQWYKNKFANRNIPNKS